MTTIPVKGRLENVIRMYNKGSLEIRQMLLQWWCRPIFSTMLGSIFPTLEFRITVQAQIAVQVGKSRV